MSKINTKSSVYLIAEVGQAHDGSLGILYSYIDAIAQTGVDAVKFQTHIAAAESSLAEPFRINFSYEDKNRFDYWDRMSFTKEQWRGIKEHCEARGVDFLSSPFSQAAVDLLEEIGTEQYKIGSGEVSNFLLLKKVCQTGKPIILSSGMCSFTELDAAVKLVQAHGNPLSILQCTTSYPTPAERIGFNVMAEMKVRYPECRIGLSEHTATIATGIAAVALGAEILEFHAVFDRRLFGPDASSSLTIDEISQLVHGVRHVEKALQHPIDKNNLTPYLGLKKIFEKSLAVNKDLDKGHTISFADLEAKKPAGQGVAANEFESILGRRLIRAKKQYDFLSAEDLD